MADEYTTVRVKKTVRDAINKMAESRNVSPSDVIESLAKSTADMTKQILISVERDRYYAFNDFAHLLHRMNLTSTPNVEDMVLFAVNNAMKGMEKSLQGTQNFQYPQSTALEEQ